MVEVKTACVAQVPVEGRKSYSGIKGSPKGYDWRGCSRGAKVALKNRDVGPRHGDICWFCRTHARMALEGYVDERGRVLDPRMRADFSRGFGGKPIVDWEEIPTVPASEHPMLDGM